MILEFLPAAQNDAQEATRYYESCATGLGARFRAQLENVSTAIAQQPLLWNERPGGYRRVNLPGFPYYVAFVLRDDRIVIVAVGHSSRRPKYWEKRAL